jgi:hypothetical protein
MMQTASEPKTQLKLLFPIVTSRIPVVGAFLLVDGLSVLLVDELIEAGIQRANSPLKIALKQQLCDSSPYRSAQAGATGTAIDATAGRLSWEYRKTPGVSHAASIEMSGTSRAPSLAVRSRWKKGFEKTVLIPPPPIPSQFVPHYNPEGNDVGHVPESVWNEPEFYSGFRRLFPRRTFSYKRANLSWLKVNRRRRPAFGDACAPPLKLLCPSPE